MSTALGSRPSPETGGVALVAFSTESPHASRADVHAADTVRTLRRKGIPSRLFHVHLDPSDTEENTRRVDTLIERLVAEGWTWAVFAELWTPEVGQRLKAAGMGVVETRTHTFVGAIHANPFELLRHVQGCSTGQPLDELTDLIEIVGPRHPRPVTAIDLRIHQACGYKRSLVDNPFYQDVFQVPEVATHRGCAHCLSARPDTPNVPDEVAVQIVERIRADRAVFPMLETFWMGFAETFYDALAIAFRNGGDDPAWRGITLAMQCRPDVIALRHKEIEALAADADACGTKVRIGVVGFENYSAGEIDVLNRGAAPDSLDAAAAIVNRWLAEPPRGLVVRGFTPSFILFTPWTRVEDLEINLQFMFRHELRNANIERLRIGPGTPAFAKARHAGLVADGPVRPAAHPNGYSSERDIRFADPRIAAVCAGFERLRPFSFEEQPELLAGVLAAVLSATDPEAINWDAVAQSWNDVSTAARGA